MGTLSLHFNASVKKRVEVEFFLAGLLKIVLAICFAHFLSVSGDPVKLNDFADSMGSIATTLAGFLLSAMALVYTLTPRPTFEIMNLRGHLRVLHSESIIAVFGLISGGLAFAYVRLYDDLFLAKVATGLVALGTLFLLDLCRKYAVVISTSFSLKPNV